MYVWRSDTRLLLKGGDDDDGGSQAQDPTNRPWMDRGSTQLSPGPALPSRRF
jgi:hypothetical protein